MPATSALKSNRTRAKNALVREDTEANELLLRDWSRGEPQELERFYHSIRKVLLNLETKLARLESANDKLADAYEQNEETQAAEQFQTTLNEESEFTDGVLDKISQLKILLETVERKRGEADVSRHRNVEQQLTRMQEQVEQLRMNSRTSRSAGLDSIWSPATGTMKPLHLEITPFAGDMLKWQEFWDMFEAAIHRAEYAAVDKLNFLRSKLTGEALEAVAGYQLSNENYPIVIDVLKKRFGNKQLIIDAHYRGLSHLPPASNHAERLRQCYDAIERHLRSLEALGEDVNHRHFVALISEKLPQRVLYQLYMQKEDNEEWTVAKLRQLLGKHITALEIADRESYPTTPQFVTSNKSVHRDGRGNSTHHKPTAGGLLAGHGKANTNSNPQTEMKCFYCDQAHWSDECSTLKTLEARKEKLKGYCFKCLQRGHISKNCRRERACAHCGRRNHHRSLCPKLFPDKNGQQPPAELQSISNTVDPETAIMASSHHVLMQTATATVKNVSGSSSASVRMILDSGSQRTYVTEKLARDLKLELNSSEKLTIVTFGSNQSKRIQCKPTKLQLTLKDGGIMVLDVSVVPDITGRVSRTPLSSEDTSFLRNEGWESKLADTLPSKAESMSIEMLVGNDYYFDLLLPRKMELGGGLSLVQSKLGWILGGRYQVTSNTTNIPTLMVCTAGMAPPGIKVTTHMLSSVDTPLLTKPTLDQFWDLESIGIIEPLSTPDDDQALESFNQSVKFSNNRYMVSWPWKEKPPDLPQNYQLALGRFRSILQKLRKSPVLLEQYNEIIQEQLNRGVIEKVTDGSEVGPTKHYIPHHPVITPTKSTTKMRIVYDASARAKKDNKSLNDCLHRGPVILPNLYGLLLRFRTSPIGVVGDLEKAFLNVGLQTQDRDVTRFLWLKDLRKPESESNLQVYRFCRVPFGIISSPFLLGATITYHLQQSGTPMAKRLKKDIYVDNVITGVNTPTEAKALYTEAKKLFLTASMNMRDWASNSKEFMEFVPQQDKANSHEHNVLGLTWNLASDELTVPGPSNSKMDHASTKREILKVIASIFDPLGYFSPTILEAKVFMKELWTKEYEWDSKLDDKQLQEWSRISENLKEIPLHNLPRYIGINTETKDEMIENSLLCFCDASAKAYATAIYLHQSFANRFKGDLIFSKTRLAPSNTTIPRLELLGVLIGVRALKFVLQELHMQVAHIFVLTDSLCVLYWLQTKKPLSVFVANRLKEIKSLEGVIFKHVPSEDNPADLATRGKSPRELSLSIWWSGPKWLKEPKEQWPNSKTPQSDNLTEFNSEVRGNKILFEAKLLAGEDPSQGNRRNLSDINEKRYSSLLKLLRVTAWLFRAVNKLMKRDTVVGPLTVLELHNAKRLWDLHIQYKCYSDSIDLVRQGKSSNLKNQLNLKLDESGILRCHGRLENAELTQGAKHPKLLPKEEYFTRLVIEDHHRRVLHSGISQTLAQVRYEYWIPHGRATVKKVLKDCRICRRVEGNPFVMPKMPPLPAERVARSLPFEYTGLDYLGPLYIKSFPQTDKQVVQDTRKVWICLFTCLAVRAVHLELVDDMSAEEFILCLRRFIARRGIPRQIISDNAKQFKLARTTLNKAWSNTVFSDNVSDFTANQGIQWRFIVELAPWMGGFYERLVGLTKRALRKTIVNRSLTEKQLVTVVTEVEAVINSRPLVYVDADINSSITLTPLDFLSFHSHHVIPDLIDETDPDFSLSARVNSSQQLLEKWKCGQKRLNQFWSLWRNEYLLNLRERAQMRLKEPHGKVTGPPRVGDVVLIKDDLPRGRWKVGRVCELIRGKDWKVRSAKIIVGPRKYLHRALSLLYPIECPDQDNSVDFTEVSDSNSATHVVNNDDDKSERMDSNGDDASNDATDPTDDASNDATDPTDDASNNATDPTGDDEIDDHPMTTGRPIRKATVLARQKLKQWLKPDDVFCLARECRGSRE